jgi:hypothetical protein
MRSSRPTASRFSRARPSTSAVVRCCRSIRSVLRRRRVQQVTQLVTRPVASAALAARRRQRSGHPFGSPRGDALAEARRENCRDERRKEGLRRTPATLAARDTERLGLAVTSPSSTRRRTRPSASPIAMASCWRAFPTIRNVTREAAMDSPQLVAAGRVEAADAFRSRDADSQLMAGQIAIATSTKTRPIRVIDACPTERRTDYPAPASPGPPSFE